MNCNKVIGEVTMYVGEEAPFYYKMCNGELLDKGKFMNIYRVIGDKYTDLNDPNYDPNYFNLPDFQLKFPWMDLLGKQTGEKEVILDINQLPSHSHSINAVSRLGNTNIPTNNLIANAEAFDNDFSTNRPDVQMDSNMISNTGNGLPHNNIPPALGINFIIYTGV